MKGHSHFSHARKSANVLSKTAFALGLLCALVITLLTPCASYSQDTGYISGTVVDKSGAAVVGAEINITSTAGSLTRNTTSNADGAYVIPGLPGDTYNLSVSAKGFQKYTAQKINLNVAEKARVDVTLTVGALSEEITVTGEAPQVNTTSATTRDRPLRTAVVRALFQPSVWNMLQIPWSRCRHRQAIATM